MFCILIPTAHVVYNICATFKELIIQDSLSCSEQLDEDGSKTPTAATATVAAATTTNSSGKKKGRHYKIYAVPIAEDANCFPASYQYRVKMKDGSLQVVNATTLRSV